MLPDRRYPCMNLCDAQAKIAKLERELKLYKARVDGDGKVMVQLVEDHREAVERIEGLQREVDNAEAIIVEQAHKLEDLREYVAKVKTLAHHVSTTASRLAEEKHTAMAELAAEVEDHAKTQHALTVTEKERRKLLATLDSRNHELQELAKQCEQWQKAAQEARAGEQRIANRYAKVVEKLMHLENGMEALRCKSKSTRSGT